MAASSAKNSVSVVSCTSPMISDGENPLPVKLPKVIVPNPSPANQRFAIWLDGLRFGRWQRLRSMAKMKTDNEFASYLFDLAKLDVEPKTNYSGEQQSSPFSAEDDLEEMNPFVKLEPVDQDNGKPAILLPRRSVRCKNLDQNLVVTRIKSGALNTKEYDSYANYGPNEYDLNAIGDIERVYTESNSCMPSTSSGKCDVCTLHHYPGACKQKCDHCGKAFASVTGCKRHIRELHVPAEERVKFKCQFCSKMFLSKFSHKKHEHEMHILEKKFPCSECSLRFATEEHLKKHVAYTHEEKRFRCSLCGKNFAEVDRLTVHMQNTHTPEAMACNEICEHCGKGFNTQRKLKTHMLSVHSTTKVQCEICGKICKSTLARSNHKYAQHSEAIKKKQNLSCVYCGKVYQTPPGLHQHIQVCHNGIRLQCELCNMVFTTRYMVQVHIAKVHGQGKTDVSCTQCHMKFSHQHDVNQHILQKHKPPSKKCEICQKMYRTKYQLDKHQQISHENVKSFQCSICHHSFGYPQHLRRHLKQVHAGSLLDLEGVEMSNIEIDSVEADTATVEGADSAIDEEAIIISGQDAVSAGENIIINAVNDIVQVDEDSQFA